MKENTINGLIDCPVCGHQVVLRCNASKLFQVRCPKCYARTGWKRKDQAIITWYNMVIQYMRNNNTLMQEE